MYLFIYLLIYFNFHLLDLFLFFQAQEIDGIKIFRYSGTLNFANNSHFKYIVYKLIGIYPQEIIKRRKKLIEESQVLNDKNVDNRNELQCIIMDMSALNYIDPSSVHVLHVIVEEFAQVNIEFYFVNCLSPVFEMIKKCDKYMYGAISFKIFATVQDAVIYFQSKVATR